MTRFDWSLPYTSRRQPILARSIAATSTPLAAQAGLEMIRRGGNAADAAIATAACMTVVEPTSNGIGSDAFSLAWMSGELHGLNGSGRSPMGLDAERILALDTYPRDGWDPITVPGAVKAWVDMSNRFGALDFAECLQPAIRHAANGYLLSPETARAWQRAVERFGASESWRDTFLRDGRAPAEGDLVRLPDHARTLESIAETSGSSFYQGELAQRIVDASQNSGGSFVMNDLEKHESEWVTPISLDYRGRIVNEIPPNGQGIAALIALGVLRHFDIASMTVDAPEVLHLQIEAMKIGFADAHRWVADPEHLQTTAEALLEADRLEGLAATIDRSRAQNFDAGVPKPGGTIYLSTADHDGNCVSWIQSNYTGFGSGVVIPETGIAMQNRGACFTLEAGHPNVVAGGKRPYNTIIPGMLTPADGAPETDLMTFGVMGGFMQPQGQLQVVSHLVDFDRNPQAALDAPRWQWQKGLSIDIEPGFDDGVIEALRTLGHEITVSKEMNAGFGRGQAIHRIEHGWCAGSDPRADGQAVGI